MITREVRLFAGMDFITAAAGPRSRRPHMAGGFEPLGTCIAAEVVKGAQRG
jgi:hypothetical protein